VAPEPAALDAILPELLQVEASGWKGREGTAILADERMKRFFEGYARASAGLGLLRVSRLTVGDVLVAFQLGVEHAGRLWTLKIGHREDWGRCSPGILLTHLTIRESFRRGLEAYEFLGVDQPWIRRWTARMHPYVGVRLYPLAWRSVRDLWRHASGFVSNALGWAMQECQP
jgi:CelD/BcsL family acetyltransferase involved in cellulose biosynthesis